MNKDKAPTIKVSYYNKEHEKLLKKTPRFEQIKKLVEQGHSINEDFWVYSVFTDQSNDNGFRTFEDLAVLWMDLYKYTGRYFDFEDETVKAKYIGDKYKGLQLTERIGVAGGLSVISSIHDLTEADWEVIPVTNNKDLDFEIASDGENIIEVECKGSFVENELISSSISKHKSDIEAKKKNQRELGNKNLLYGVITSYSNEEHIMAHSRLLDPVSNREYGDPYKLRILSRLRFYLREIRRFSKCHFLIALANRINVLNSSDDDSYKNFDNLSLVNAKGETFEYPVSLEQNKSVINSSNNIGFGDVAIYDEGSDEYFIFGFDREIIEILINQDFDELINYRKKPNTFSANIEARVRKSEFNKVITIDLYGNLQVNSAGRIVGFAKSNKDSLKYDYND